MDIKFVIWNKYDYSLLIIGNNGIHLTRQSNANKKFKNDVLTGTIFPLSNLHLKLLSNLVFTICNIHSEKMHNIV